MKTTMFNINFSTGKLEPVQTEGKNALGAGTILRLHGYNEPEYVISQNLGINPEYEYHGARYECIDLETCRTCSKNAHSLYFPGETVGIHTEITDRIIEPDILAWMEEIALLNIRYDNEEKERKGKESAAKLEKGKAVYEKHIPADVPFLIVAESKVDDSDIMTDYFASHTSGMVILALSYSKRDNFAEMRKAAAKFEQTKHLGPGCDDWQVMRKAAENDEYNRHWMGCLQDAEGNDAHFLTEAEAQKAMSDAMAKDKECETKIPFEPFCPILPYGGELRSESVEHREKYSMGSGYYLGKSKYSGWIVKKVSKDWNKELIYASLANSPFCIFENLQEKPSQSAEVVTVDGAEVRENPEKDGIEIKFPGKPASSMLETLKANGWRWSRFAKVWYNRATEENRAFAKSLMAA